MLLMQEINKNTRNFLIEMNDTSIAFEALKRIWAARKIEKLPSKLTNWLAMEAFQNTQAKDERNWCIRCKWNGYTDNEAMREYAM